MLANRVRMGSGVGEIDDNSGSPGSPKLIAGTMEAGFFGEVPVEKLFTGIELADLVGITQGTSQFNNEPWLKFAIDGEVIFKSKKTYRKSISWRHIDSKGCVYGEKQIAKNGIQYKVTLIKGGNGDKSDSLNGPQNSEWNRLMLPIHIRAEDQSWISPDDVNIPTQNWKINFTDEDLQTESSFGHGSSHVCQEKYYNNSRFAVVRGYNGVSFAAYDDDVSTLFHRGWSPVLRVVK